MPGQISNVPGHSLFINGLGFYSEMSRAFTRSRDWLLTILFGFCVVNLTGRILCGIGK